MVNKRKSVNKSKLNRVRENAKSNKKKNLNNNTRLNKSSKLSKYKKVKGRSVHRLPSTKNRRSRKRQRGGYTTTSVVSHTQAVSHTEPLKTKCVIKDVSNSNSNAFQDSFKKHNDISNNHKSLADSLNSFIVRGVNGIGNKLFSKF